VLRIAGVRSVQALEAHHLTFKIQLVEVVEGFADKQVADQWVGVCFGNRIQT